MTILKKSLEVLAVSSVIVAALIGSSVSAEPIMFKATPIKNVKVASVPKAPKCGPGFTPVGMKLIQHEGHKWYEYSCAQQKLIKRVCNADTDVTQVKDEIKSLPSDGQSKNSKLMLSYKCFNYVPVE